MIDAQWQRIDELWQLTRPKKLSSKSYHATQEEERGLRLQAYSFANSFFCLN